MPFYGVIPEEGAISFCFWLKFMAKRVRTRTRICTPLPPVSQVGRPPTCPPVGRLRGQPPYGRLRETVSLREPTGAFRGSRTGRPPSDLRSPFSLREPTGAYGGLGGSCERRATWSWHPLPSQVTRSFHSLVTPSGRGWVPHRFIIRDLRVRV